MSGPVKHTSLGVLEPPTFRLTADRANRLRLRGADGEGEIRIHIHNMIATGGL